MLLLLFKCKLGLVTLITIIAQNVLSVSSQSPASRNWNSTGLALQLSNENKNRLKIGIHNVTDLTNASGNRQNEMGLSSLKKPDCVPLASYTAFFKSKSSWVASLDVNGLLSKKVMTTTGFVTSYGYRGCFLGFGTIETTVMTLTSTPDYPQTQPACGTNADGCGQCVIFAESVHLLYWPVNTYSGNHNKSISSTEDGTFNTTSNGVTFISPSVYLSYENVWTSRDFCRNTGKNYSGALLTLNPEYVSTRVDLKYREVNESQVSKMDIYPSFIYRRLHYADLNTPISASFSRLQVALAASSLPLRLQGYCDNKTAIQPILPLPNQIRDLDPNWKDCDLSNWGTQDPPRSLRPVDVLSGPTSSVDPVVPSLTAVPVALPQPHTATSTADQASAATIKSTSTDGASASPSSPLDSLSKVSKSRDSPVKSPASSQPASKVALTVDPQVFTTNVKESPSTSSKAISHDETAMKNSEPTLLDSSSTSTIDIHTIPLSPAIALPHLTIGAQIFSPDPTGAYAMGGQTLTPGGVITLSGTPVSLALSATALIIPSVATPSLSATGLPILTIGSQTISADPSGVYQIMGHTLSLGGGITLSGTRISLAPSAKALVINSVTTPLTPALAPPPLLRPLSLDSHTFTADSSSAYHIMGYTLTPGGAITISATPISLAPLETAVVIGTSTEILPPPASTAPGLGELINSAFGHSGGSSASTTNRSSTADGNTSYSGVVFTGDSERGCRIDWWWAVVPMMGGLRYVI